MTREEFFARLRMCAEDLATLGSASLTIQCQDPAVLGLSGWPIKRTIWRGALRGGTRGPARYHEAAAGLLVNDGHTFEVALFYQRLATPGEAELVRGRAVVRLDDESAAVPKESGVAS